MVDKIDTIKNLEERCRNSRNALKGLEKLMVYRGVKQSTPTDRIDIEQLQKGDILLSYGIGCIARLVRIFDRCEYSHAAIFDGESVLEARMGGVSRRPIDSDEFQDFLQKNICYTHVYRIVKWNSDDPEQEIEKVLNIAGNYVKAGSSFDFLQLFTLASLVLVRQMPKHPLIKGYTYLFLSDIVDMLTDFWTQHGQVESMVCSEFVYRCFSEAYPGEDHPLRLLHAVRYRDALQLKIRELRKRYRLFRFASREKAHRLSLQVLTEKVRLDEVLKKIESSSEKGMEVAADFVTSRDIMSSPNIRRVGILDYSRFFPDGMNGRYTHLCE